MVQKDASMKAEEKQSKGTSLDEGETEKRVPGGKRSRKRRITIFLLVCLLNVGLLALLWSQLLTPAQKQSNAGGTGSSSPLIGHPAPDFSLAVLSSRPASTIHLASLKGKLVMLNFWASWCVPCQHEAPLLQATWRSVQKQGVIFLGIDFQDARNDGLNFLHTYGITYLNVVDSTGATAINYGLSGVPETFFLNRQGIIVSKVIGELTKQTLQSNLQALLRSP